MSSRARIIQIITIVIVQAVTLLLLTAVLPGLSIDSFGSAVIVALVLIFSQSLYWWLFISFFSWLPVWLYPMLTFILSGIVIIIVGNFVEGVNIEGLSTGIWISLVMTGVNAILGVLLSLDMDQQFDRNVTRKMVARHENEVKTDVPGFVFLEIDGLGEKLFRRALNEGHMPTLKRWLDDGTHEVLGWETDFTSQTGSMQPGILLGNNDEIPAFRWWSRQEGKLVASNDPRDAKVNEARLSNGNGLLAGGGASRGNMYTGDAAENLMTFSAVLDRQKGSSPGFYLYLLSPYVVARLVTRYFSEVVKEWWQAWQQKRRKDKYIVKLRSPLYAFFRAFMGPLMQDLVTYAVINDIVRGLPAIYALYAGYDDLGHFAGMQTPEAFEALKETDHYFARIESALQFAPRPYHLIVLSDHGQSDGPTFQSAHGMSLNDLIQSLIKGDEQVFAALNTNESWGSINAFLNESVNADTRTASVLRTMLRSKTSEDDLVGVGPDQNQKAVEKGETEVKESQVIALASGCTGLIYFTEAKDRVTYEEIQARYPDFILSLVSHPGIGFVLVRSEKDGDMVLSSDGIHFLDDGTVEEVDPLAVYGPNAAMLLKRESNFKECPDLILNTKYDPQSEELCGFEDQVSHHGGFGGPQNNAFIYHPVSLSPGNAPIVGAMNVYRLLRGWRDTLQGSPTNLEGQTSQTAETGGNSG
jgi:putative membrane protein